MRIPDTSTDVRAALGRWTSAAEQALQLGVAWAEAVWIRWRVRARQGQRTGDYRDRISVATWLLVLGLGASLLIQFPSITISFWALGSPISLPLTDTIWASIFLAVMAAAGTESVIQVHPRVAERRRPRIATWPFWALPMAIMVISAVLLSVAPTPFLQVLGLMLSGLLLGVAFFALYATVERRPGFRRARIVLDALAYGAALLLFLFVYQTRTRSLLSGTLVAMTAMLLAIEILRTTSDRPDAALRYGGIIGLILGQVTWALNYWLLPGLTGSLLLLLIFYLLVGIAQQDMLDRLNRRVLLEFGLFAAIALVLIILVGPGFSL